MPVLLRNKPSKRVSIEKYPSRLFACRKLCLAFIHVNTDAVAVAADAMTYNAHPVAAAKQSNLDG